MIRASAFLLFLSVASTSTAATFVVDSSADTSSVGTLRWAIEQHLSAGGSNTITFDSSLSDQTIALSSNLPQLFTGSLTIDGGGAPGVAIAGSPLGRIFIVNGLTSFVLRNLELRDSDGSFGGGCIRASNVDTVLTVERVSFFNCQQETFNTFDAFGGAILAEFNTGGNGGLIVRDSRFSGNRVTGSENFIFGGAIFVSGTSVRLERNVFELNSAEDTGSAFQQGGAVFVSNADAEIHDNEFLFNQVVDGAGGALVLNLRPENDAFVTGNLFAANVARLGAAVWTGTQVTGSGAPFMNFTHNTFLTNTSDEASGAALFLREGRVLIRSNSFIDNINLSAGAAHLAYNPGNTEFFSFWNNLFGPASSPSCATTDGNTVPYPSAGYNLRPDNSCNFNGFNDLVGDAGPFLALGDYGGPTRTMPPASGNLALDNGNPQPPGLGNAALCLDFDARGRPRPGDGDADSMPICDMGVFEWAHEAPLFLGGFEDVGLTLP
jgi:hypothetical protein